jgi:hypothetical protein
MSFQQNIKNLKFRNLKNLEKLRIENLKKINISGRLGNKHFKTSKFPNKKFRKFWKFRNFGKNKIFIKKIKKFRKLNHGRPRGSPANGRNMVKPAQDRPRTAHNRTMAGPDHGQSSPWWSLGQPTYGRTMVNPDHGRTMASSAISNIAHGRSMPSHGHGRVIPSEVHSQ